MKKIQEDWFGWAKFLLKKISRSVPFLQNQERLLPNEGDGISVIAFSFPETCKGVNGDAPEFLNVALMLALAELQPINPSSQGGLHIQ